VSGKNSPVGPDSSSAPSPSALSAADGQFDAFISYRRISSDIAFVDQLQRDLAARGLSAWIDREEIEPAANWADRIIRGLDASRSFVFVLTPESAADSADGDGADELSGPTGEFLPDTPIHLTRGDDEQAAARSAYPVRAVVTGRTVHRQLAGSTPGTSLRHRLMSVSSPEYLV